MEKFRDINRVLIAPLEKFGWTLEEAQEKMSKIRIILIAHSEIKNSVALQTAFLTALNCASRSFEMTIDCVIPEDTPKMVNWPSQSSFKEIVSELKGSIIDQSLIENKVGFLKILFGGKIEDDESIQVIANGWQAGLNTFYSDNIELCSEVDHPLGGVAAGALAIFEVFAKVFEFSATAFIKGKGISLWNPDEIEGWYEESHCGPVIKYFPKDIWFSGLGHLGQASVWLLGFYDFVGRDVCCVLQDDDTVDKSNLYTQVLSNNSDVGKRKARICSTYLEERGLSTRIIEKRMTPNEYQDCEKLEIPVLINGYDNVDARRIIQPGAFDLIIDSGVGSSVDLFDSITQYGFPLVNETPANIWPLDEEVSERPNPNYVKMLDSETSCGMVFNSSIATPFVGCFSAALTWAEVLRAYNEGSRLILSSLQMRSLDNRNFYIDETKGTNRLFVRTYISLS